MTSSNVRKLVTRADQVPGLPFPADPHMLRHAYGFKLANNGHDTRALQHYLGHKNIQHTVRYTELAPDRFNSFWKDSSDFCRDAQGGTAIGCDHRPTLRVRAACSSAARAR